MKIHSPQSMAKPNRFEPLSNQDGANKHFTMPTSPSISSEMSFGSKKERAVRDHQQLRRNRHLRNTASSTTFNASYIFFYHTAEIILKYECIQHSHRRKIVPSTSAPISMLTTLGRPF
jgi:hypothetical protein